MAAKTIPGYASSIINILEADDKVIPLKDTQTILNRLKPNEWTTLLIQDPTGYEVVKVLNFQGNIAIERGLSGTTPKRFPVGSCVTFSPSDELLKALVCETDCCPEGEDKNYGTVATAPSSVALEIAPNTVIGGASAILGEPTGFMLINGKKVPYYEG
jgi:hypothetical protein|nr:MAG TPA: hypothetical protein [Caudoviricetes sp.]